LGARSNVAAGYGVVPAIAAQHDRRLSGRSTGTECAGTRTASPGTGSAGTGCRARGSRTRTGTAGSSGARARTGTTGSSRTHAPSAAQSAESTGTVKRQAADIALAHGSVPRGLDLPGFRVDCDAVVDAV